MGVCVNFSPLSLPLLSVSQYKCISEQPEGQISNSGHCYCYLKFYSVFSIDALTQKTDGAGVLSCDLFSWHLIEGRLKQTAFVCVKYL